MNRLLGALIAVATLVGTGCTQVDLTKALSVTNVLTGYYHVGTTDGLNKMVPSLAFSLQNVGEANLNRVQLMVSFWQVGGENLELDSKQIEGIGADELTPGASTQPLLVRSEKGYTLSIEAPREQMFENALFQDVLVKVFARRDGRLVPLGEYPIERRLIPSSAASSAEGAPSTP